MKPATNIPEVVTKTRSIDLGRSPPKITRAFGEVKELFDPQGLLNPGKIVDAPPLVNSLRYGPAYVTPDVSTVLTRVRSTCTSITRPVTWPA